MSKHDRRFWGAGPWPDGQFYVWDSRTSGITNPDGEDGGYPWRRLNSMQEAEDAAGDLNDNNPDPIYRIYRDHPEWGQTPRGGGYLADHYENGLKGVDKPEDYPALSAWHAGRDTAIAAEAEAV